MWQPNDIVVFPRQRKGEWWALDARPQPPLHFVVRSFPERAALRRWLRHPAHRGRPCRVLRAIPPEIDRQLQALMQGDFGNWKHG